MRVVCKNRKKRKRNERKAGICKIKRKKSTYKTNYEKRNKIGE